MKLTICALCLFAITTEARADDPAPALSRATVADWSGPYVGLSYGQGSGDVDDSYNFGVFAFTQGSVAGGFAGFNLQRGALVYGGELGLSRPSGMAFVGGDGDDTPDLLIDLSARLGYATGKALIYGKLGYSEARLTINDTYSPKVGGVSLGVGVEYQVTDRFLLGLDYTSRRMQGADDTPPFPYDMAPDIDSVSLRLALRF